MHDEFEIRVKHYTDQWGIPNLKLSKTEIVKDEKDYFIVPSSISDDELTSLKIDDIKVPKAG